MSDNDNGKGGSITFEQMQSLLAQQAQAFQAQIAEMRADMSKLATTRQATSSGSISNEPIGSIYARFIAEKCDGANIGKLTHRPEHASWQTVIYQRSLILDLKFRFQDQEISLRDLPCSQASPPLVDAWFRQLARTPKLRGGKFKPSSLNRAVNSLQGAVSWDADVAGYESPIRGIKRLSIKGHGRKGHFKDESQLEEFLRFCRPLHADMWRLAINSGGMRRDEIRLLSTCELNPDEQVITFAPGERTKNREGRFFGVRDEEMPMVLRRKEDAEARGPCSDPKCPMPRLLREDGKSPTHYHLFAEPDDADASPVNYWTLGDWQEKAAEKWAASGAKSGGLIEGGEVPTFHHARHTWATWASLKGVGLESILRQGGWADAKMAMHYVQKARDMLKLVKQAFSKSVAEAIAEQTGRKRAA